MNREINKRLEVIRDNLAEDLQEAVDPQDHAAKLLAKHKGLEKMLTDKVKKLSAAFVGANKRLERHRKSGVGESEAIFLLKSTKKVFDELNKMMGMIEKEYEKGGV
jgi:hypothetical protein